MLKNGLFVSLLQLHPQFHRSQVSSQVSSQVKTELLQAVKQEVRRCDARTHRGVDLDQSDVGLLVHVFDFCVKRGSALQLHLINQTRYRSRCCECVSSVCSIQMCRSLSYLHSVFVGHDVSVGDDESIL